MIKNQNLGRSKQSNTTFEYYTKLYTLFKKWWWAISLIAVLSAVGTYFYTGRITPEFRGKVTVEVKQKEQTIVNVEGIQSVTANQEFLKTQIELLKSRKLMLAVAEQLNLASAKDMLSSEELMLPREKRLKEVVDILQERLTVLPVGRSRLITISFEHPNKERTALIPNTIIDTFISDTDQGKIDSTDRAKSFLKDQLQLAKESLGHAEEQLISYAEKNNLLILGNDENKNISSSLDTEALIQLNSELTIAKTARIKAEQAFLLIKLEGGGVETISDDTILKLKNQKIELESEYAENATIYKPAHPKMLQLQSRIDLYKDKIAQRAGQIREKNLSKYRTEYELALKLENSLKQRVDKLKKSVIDLRTKSIEYSLLRRNVEIERTQYNSILQRLKEVSVSDDLGSNLVQVVDYAEVPVAPFKPNRLFLSFLAGLLAVALAAALAFAFDFFDDRIKVPDDVKNKLNQILMGVIPVIKNDDDFEEILADPQSVIAEAYATLRTNLQYSGPNGGPRVIQITSTRASEGKSTSSFGLALRLAGTGSRTLLIDADLRRPTFKGIKGKIGLSDLLTSNASLSAAIINSKFDKNLNFITSGVTVVNPSEILSTNRLDELIEIARNEYDHVIIDSPPVLGLADAPTIGAKVDATLVVVEAEKLYTKNVIASLDRLKISGTNILGIVLTKLNSSKTTYGEYYYSYNYSNLASQKHKRKGGKSTQLPKRKLDISEDLQ